MVGSQVVSDGTSSIYDVEVRYRAVDPDTATMFATVNGIPQGFFVGGYPNNFIQAGRSFTSISLDAMQLFWWSRFPVWQAGTFGISDISATGNLGTIAYSDLTWTKGGIGQPTYPAQFDAGEYADIWNLTAADLVLSYTVDFKNVWGNPTVYAWLMFEFGLKPDSEGIIANPAGAGWMGGVLYDLTASPSTWYLNEKFDLQTTGYDAEWQYDVTKVPEPSTMLLIGSGLIGLARYGRKKFFKK